ncbi:MAG: phosphatidate cytidylyltransferase [Ignavibacteriales bacterium]|nr:phosphatidate cytidylyltransferase [Ignavibacteriales bacterium]
MTKLSNLATRVIVALFGVPLIITLCIVGKVPFLIFVLVIGVVSFFEFHKMLARRRFIPNVLVSSASVITLILNSYLSFTDFYTLAIIIVSILLLAELQRNRESAIANVGTSLIGIFYIGLFSSSLVKLRDFYSDSFFLYDQGGYLIVSIFASIWICDSAAYFVGSAIGKHKILPRVSPHKSWEGAIAGLIFSIAIMIAAKNLIADFLSMHDAVIIGIITGTIGQAGDFVESMLKRDANVKDSSSLIPGHGGILDRFDSLLFTAPVVYLYLLFTNHIF